MTPWILIFGIWFGFAPEDDSSFQVVTLRFETKERCQQGIKVLSTMKEALGPKTGAIVIPCFDRRKWQENE